MQYRIVNQQGISVTPAVTQIPHGLQITPTGQNRRPGQVIYRNVNVNSRGGIGNQVVVSRNVATRGGMVSGSRSGVRITPQGSLMQNVTPKFILVSSYSYFLSVLCH